MDKGSVVWNERVKIVSSYLQAGRSLATWLVISDRYIDEVTLQLSVKTMAGHSYNTKPLPQELNISYSYHRHQQHIMYASFQMLSIVSFSLTSTYNKLSRIMMLCCCTHSSLIQCNHSYMIPENDAIWFEKAVTLWACAFLIESNQPESIYYFWEPVSQDVTCTKLSGWKNMHSIVVPGFNII